MLQYLNKQKPLEGVSRSGEIQFASPINLGKLSKYRFDENAPVTSLKQNMADISKQLADRIIHCKTVSPGAKLRLHHTASAQTESGEGAVMLLGNVAMQKVTKLIEDGSRASSHRAQLVGDSWLVFGYDAVLIPDLNEPGSFSLFTLNSSCAPRYNSWIDVAVFTDASNGLTSAIPDLTWSNIARAMQDAFEFSGMRSITPHRSHHMRMGDSSGHHRVGFIPGLCPAGVLALINPDVISAPSVKTKKGAHDTISYQMVDSIEPTSFSAMSARGGSNPLPRENSASIRSGETPSIINRQGAKNSDQLIHEKETQPADSRARGNAYAKLARRLFY